MFDIARDPDVTKYNNNKKVYISILRRGTAISRGTRLVNDDATTKCT